MHAAAALINRLSFHLRSAGSTTCAAPPEILTKGGTPCDSLAPACQLLILTCLNWQGLDNADNTTACKASPRRPHMGASAQCSWHPVSCKLGSARQSCRVCSRSVSCLCCSPACTRNAAQQAECVPDSYHGTKYKQVHSMWLGAVMYQLVRGISCVHPCESTIHITAQITSLMI